MWKCSKCEEKHEDVLQTCWKCGSEAASGKPHDVLEVLAEPSTLLALQEYFALIRVVPLPSCAQRRNFVDYVTSAHSWYKHLPKYLPGASFYFFIDKFAGCDRVALQDGSSAIVERETQGFHYSDIPTRQYRTLLGFLSYSCAAGTTVLFPNRGAVAIPRDKMVAIPNEDAQLCYLPQPILDAGRVQLTAIIHPRSAGYDFWDPGHDLWHARTIEPRPEIHWPSESGGQATLKKIFERCAEMRQPGYRQQQHERWLKAIKLSEACRTEEERKDVICRADLDPVLYELMEPERVRQKTEILNAIDRVCMLVNAAGLSASSGAEC